MHLLVIYTKIITMHGHLIIKPGRNVALFSANTVHTITAVTASVKTDTSHFKPYILRHRIMRQLHNKDKKWLILVKEAHYREEITSYCHLRTYTEIARDDTDQTSDSSIQN